MDKLFVGGVKHGAKRAFGLHKCIAAVAAEIRQPRDFGRTRTRKPSDQFAKALAAGTLQGSVDSALSTGISEEFTVRFNRRTSHNRVLLFRRLIGQAEATAQSLKPNLQSGDKWLTQYN